MQYTTLGRTGVQVSTLSFGTMSFGTTADETTSAAMFHRCRQAGVNVFDCADVYGDGRSEEILGRLLKTCRDDVVLATKVYFPTGKGPNDRGATRYHITRAVEASLKRLDTDRIDLYYLHRFDDRTALDETLRAIDDLVRQGKILYPAVSNYAAWQTAKALGVAALHNLSPIVCTQPMYNLAKRQAEVEILPMAASENLAVMPYNPLGGGLLAGKYGAQRRPQEGRLVSNRMYQLRYANEENFALAEAFTNLATQAGHHPATLAIAWVNHHPAITSTLIGARNVEQLDACLDAANLELSDELYDAICALSRTPPPATDRNEERMGHNYKAKR